MKNFGNAIEDRHAGAGGGALVKDADGATRRITKVRGHILSDSEHFFLRRYREVFAGGCIIWRVWYDSSTMMSDLC